MKFSISLIISFILLLTHQIFAQKVFTVAFYNTENLMDTIDNPHTLDNDFLPKGKYKWTGKRYNQKLNAIAKVISQLGDSDGPELIGLAEIENKAALKDLANTKALKNYQYAIVHYDSPDERGIDVALLYKSKSFKVTSSNVFSATALNIHSHTRDVLLVKGTVGKESLFIFVNHWPSRRKGTKETEEKRIAVATMVRQKVDSIQKKIPDAKILLMGDFNDEPFNTSILTKLKTNPESVGLKSGDLFNPFFNLSKEGFGSVKYHHEWNMFDQMLLSKGFFEGKSTIQYKKAAVYEPEWMHYQNVLKNGPARTYMGTDYKGGYSDHFPVYVGFEVR